MIDVCVPAPGDCLGDRKTTRSTFEIWLCKHRRLFFFFLRRRWRKEGEEKRENELRNWDKEIFFCCRSHNEPGPNPLPPIWKFFRLSAMCEILRWPLRDIGKVFLRIHVEWNPAQFQILSTKWQSRHFPLLSRPLWISNVVWMADWQHRSTMRRLLICLCPAIPPRPSFLSWLAILPESRLSLRCVWSVFQSKRKHPAIIAPNKQFWHEPIMVSWQESDYSIKNVKPEYAVDGEFKATFLNRRPSSSSRDNKKTPVSTFLQVFLKLTFWQNAVSAGLRLSCSLSQMCGIAHKKTLACTNCKYVKILTCSWKSVFSRQLSPCPTKLHVPNSWQSGGCSDIKKLGFLQGVAYVVQKLIMKIVCVCVCVCRPWQKKTS